jgi:hypothetical protein
MDQVLGADIARAYTAAEIIATDGLANVPVLGSRFEDGRNGKRYRFMRATTAWTANDLVVRDYAGANEPNDGAPCSAVAQPVAGIAVSTVAINGGGWVQTEGEYPTANIAASTAGQIIGTTATTGRGTGIIFGTPSAAEVAAGMAAVQSTRITALDVAAGNLCQVVLAP